MAGPDGQTTDSLNAKLAAEPFAFDFYAAVRLLQSQARGQPRIGHSQSPVQDPVRFAQSPHLDFPPSTLERFQQRDGGRAPVLFTRHVGLFGPNGPLPLCLTEFARQRILPHGDTTFANFCNVFHHRLISFFFRAWADAQKTVDCDRPENETWSYFIGSLVGVGMDSLRERGIAATRQLAKRQITWLRSMPQRHAIACDQPQAVAALVQAVLQHLRQLVPCSATP